MMMESAFDFSSIKGQAWTFVELLDYNSISEEKL
jgi:hypothetical protein